MRMTAFVSILIALALIQSGCKSTRAGNDRHNLVPPPYPVQP